MSFLVSAICLSGNCTDQFTAKIDASDEKEAINEFKKDKEFLPIIKTVVENESDKNN